MPKSLLTIEERFWSKVDKGLLSEGCWIWTASQSDWGYGYFSVDGRMKKAHRVSWTIVNGEIPEGLHVLHRCDNPPCVNPSHLFLGTHQDNMADHVAKGRTSGASGEHNGRARLSIAEVRKIRERLAAGLAQKDIAGEFGVCQQSVSAINRRSTWNAFQ